MENETKPSKVLRVLKTLDIKRKPGKGYYIGFNSEGFMYIFEGKRRGRYRLKPEITESPTEEKKDVLG